ncbi:hypothetical protein NEOLI_002464 [Neolecta irregularis DAH-3]|uniref:Uncharacterized protein n=1 Tax=Neolecta irregularis (strain DAH-3) TaxID=1198029 RepID=A0A1U7LJ38_NEOID|nr:hypothetical protein NEOLI_002464 [Neolecta irregularis DAH-3]|eukprot:OLL22659.1 hypothetical protein NEOLI_002464 [Neolecta irregularis DAH-3]
MTSTYPLLLSLHDLQLKEQETSKAELAWVLSKVLPRCLASLRDTLAECQELLQPREPGVVLPLSSVRSEALKGFIRRVGTQIVKSEMQIKIQGLIRGQLYKISLSPGDTITINQLAMAQSLIEVTLEQLSMKIDLSNSSTALGHIDTLLSNLKLACNSLKTPSPAELFPQTSINHELDQIFSPPLPSHVSVNIHICEAAIITEIRTLVLHDERPKNGEGGMASKLGLIRINPNAQDDVYEFEGGYARVVDRVRVESQDPNIISLSAKLAGV